MSIVTSSVDGVSFPDEIPISRVSEDSRTTNVKWGNGNKIKTETSSKINKTVKIEYRPAHGRVAPDRNRNPPERSRSPPKRITTTTTITTQEVKVTQDLDEELEGGNAIEAESGSG